MYEGFFKIENSGVERLFGGEVERSLWERKKLGDKKAMEQLLFLHNKLVFDVLNKNFRVSYSLRSLKEDLEQEGFSSLHKAILYFDPDRGIKFSTYAHKCIRNDIFFFLCKMKRAVSFPPQAFIGKDGIRGDASELCLFDSSAEIVDFDSSTFHDDLPSSGIESFEVFEWRRRFFLEMSDLLDDLYVKNKDLLNNTFFERLGFFSEDFEGKHWGEIGEICSVSRERIRQVFNIILDAIKKDELIMKMLEDF